jgi:hypothetical protein
MPNRSDNDRPLLWANKLPKNNVIVLTDRAVFVGTVATRDIANVESDVQEGEAPQDLLDNCRKILFKRLMRFQYHSTKLHPNALLTLYYEEDGVECKQVLALGLPAHRDAFVVELNARLGDWPASEVTQYPVVTVLKYIALLFGILMATSFLAIAEWMGWIQAAPAPAVLCLDLCGVWGVFGAGTFFFILVLIKGIVDLIHPPLTITHEPDDT